MKNLNEYMEVVILDNEYWWGGSVNAGHDMPYSVHSDCTLNLYGDRENDQFAPLLVSSKGRYIWSEEYFRAEIKNGIIKLNGLDKFELCEGYGNLKGAYLAAMEKHFKFTGKLPEKMFWEAPQYNTWIELGTEQTTEKILDYAKGILDNGLPPGILMIDGGWQEDYGVFEFHRGKVPNPKYLIDELHKLGFKVMLWVSPIISAAGEQFKKLSELNYLVRDKDNEIAIRKWWSGYSAVLDFTNPDAVAWYHSQLSGLMERYNVEGFKFDAGDRYFYEDEDIIFTPMPARNQTMVFNEVGEKYSFNEFRAAWKFGGRAIVSRLHDKYHTWNDFGLNTLIPHTMLQGLLGYAYCCPDMVGGGIIDCFGNGQKLDEELFVRWAQANALMPMMQMSVAPWRVLEQENAKLVVDAIRLHAEFADEFYSLAENSAKTGEPIARHMAYEFADEDFETENGQFMIGSNLLVAPVLEANAKVKAVRLPKGIWIGTDGREYDGGCVIDFPVDIASILYFRKK